MNVRTPWNAAPFAALFLLLIVGTTALPNSKGLRLRVVEFGPCGMDVGSRDVVIQVLSRGRLRINAEEVSPGNLGDLLDEIFGTRVEQVAFVTAEPDVPFQEVAGVIDVATAHAANVALVPQSADAALVPAHDVLSRSRPGIVLCPRLVPPHRNLPRTAD